MYTSALWVAVERLGLLSVQDSARLFGKSDMSFDIVIRSGSDARVAKVMHIREEIMFG